MCIYGAPYKNPGNYIIIFTCCPASGLFWWSPTIHRCISQNKDKMEEFLLFRSPFSSTGAYYLGIFIYFGFYIIQFIAICQNQSYLHNSSLFWLMQQCFVGDHQNKPGSEKRNILTEEVWIRSANLVI